MRKESNKTPGGEPDLPHCLGFILLFSFFCVTYTVFNCSSVLVAVKLSFYGGLVKRVHSNFPVHLSKLKVVLKGGVK